MSRKLRGKDYVGCLLQILQIVTGLIAIIVFIRQCSGGWNNVTNRWNCAGYIRYSRAHFAASIYSGKTGRKHKE